MTDQTTDTHSPSPAAEPLALKLTEGLGAAPETRRVTLAEAKKGDAVALYRRCGGVLQRWQIARCTATRITVDDKQYTRKGCAVGEARDSWRGPSEWVEVWDETKHPAEIERKRAQSRLDKSRAKLANFRWTAVTQAQADAIFAAMQAAGMLESA
jgi:hypothetical protein